MFVRYHSKSIPFQDKWVTVKLYNFILNNVVLNFSFSTSFAAATLLVSFVHACTDKDIANRLCANECSNAIMYLEIVLLHVMQVLSDFWRD